MYRNLRITAVVPALNEALAIGSVVNGLLTLHDRHGRSIVDAVIVADNGSSDGTGVLARAAGATVVSQPQRGYGAACWAAIEVIADTDVVLFIDGDGSVRPDQVPFLLDKICAGADLVVGSRRLGYVEAGAMTLSQQLGTDLVAKVISWLWQAHVTDLGPFRAIRDPALQALNMQDRAYGWTVEMQVKTLQLGFRVEEVPVDCLVRLGKSKISGTVRGVVGAALGMLGMIVRLWWQEFRHCHFMAKCAKNGLYLDRDSFQ